MRFVAFGCARRSAPPDGGDLPSDELITFVAVCALFLVGALLCLTIIGIPVGMWLIREGIGMIGPSPFRN